MKSSQLNRIRSSCHVKMALARVAIDLTPHNPQGNLFNQPPQIRTLSTPPHFPDHIPSGANHRYYRVTYHISGSHFAFCPIIKRLVGFLPTEGSWDAFVDNVVLELKKYLIFEAAARNGSELRTASLEYLWSAVCWERDTFIWPHSQITHANWSQMMTIVQERGLRDILQVCMRLDDGFANGA